MSDLADHAYTASLRDAFSIMLKKPPVDLALPCAENRNHTDALENC
ncbi:MAG: hypothetical protein WBO06_07890 [Gammaproteobacteria bacterium]